MADDNTNPNPLPVCSVCIANYNGEQMLAECLDSVFGQQCDFAFEVIVHDDASTDASLALLRDRYPHVQVLASDTNVGFCIANNRMVDRARGEFVLLLNNDAALHTDALATLLGAARNGDNGGILTVPQYDWDSGRLIDNGCLLDPFYNPVPSLDMERGEVAMAIGACLFLPRVLWKELGGFPEWMESIAEDLYLCCLARLRGARVRALAASGYRHRRGASFSGERADGDKLVTTFRRRRLSERNKTATLFVCTPTPLMWPLFALHLLALCCEGVLLTCVKRDRTIWRDIYGAAMREQWSQRERLQRLRRDAQATRRVGLLQYLRAFRPLPYKLTMLLRHGLPAIRR